MFHKSLDRHCYGESNCRDKLKGRVTPSDKHLSLDLLSNVLVGVNSRTKESVLGL